MSDSAVPNPDTEAERLEAALERIAALARRPSPAAPPASSEPDTAHEQAGAELDVLIAKLRERLGGYEEPSHLAAADGDDASPTGASTGVAGIAGEGI